MLNPDLPTIPQAPSIGIALDGAIDIAKRVGDLTGVSSLPGKLRETTQFAADVVRRNLDPLLKAVLRPIDSAIDEATEAASRAVKGLEELLPQIDNPIDKVQEEAKDILRGLSRVPEEAAEGLEEGKRVFRRARTRADSMRQWSRRLKQRRQRISQITFRHWIQLTRELEEELEADAAEAERLGDQTLRVSQEAYDRTRSDAIHYTTSLIMQTSSNVSRVRRLKNELRSGKLAVRDWARQKVRKAKSFATERGRALFAVRSFPEADKWGSETLSGGKQLVGDLAKDLAAKPSEIISFGQKRVNEAMELADSVKRQVKTAREWRDSQRGTHAQWKLQMRQSRTEAEFFLDNQALRVVTKAEQQESLLEQDLALLGKEQVADTRRTAEEIRTGSRQDRLDYQAAPQPRVDSKEPTETADEFDLPVQTPEEKAEAKEEPVEPPEKVSEPAPPTPPSAKAPTKAAPKNDNAPDKPRPQPASTDATSATIKPEVKAGESNVKEAPKPPVSTSHSETTVATKPVPAPKTEKIDVAAVAPAAPPAPAVDSKVRKGQSIKPIPPPKVQPAKAGAPAANGEAKAKAKPTSAAPETKASASKRSDDTKEPPTLRSVAPPGTILNPEAAKKKAKPEEAAKLLGNPVGAPIQRKEATNKQPADPAATRDRLVAANGTGVPPDPTIKSHLAPHVGFDPSVARLHTGPSAHAAAQALNAEAFTIGRDVFFAEGKYDPKSPQGLGLIAHELTHVGQQLGMRGDKARFITKEGGDAMEQEAQEIGERVASNLAYGPSLRVGKYVRVYEPEDDLPIAAGMQLRLDRLSMQAITEAGRNLARRGRPMAQRIDEVDVELSLDLEEMSDREIVVAWADAIVAAVELAPRTTRSAFDVAEATAPATELLQARFGDPGEKKAEPPKVQPDPEAVAKMARVTASAEEKDMMRKLLVRQEVDELITKSKAKQRQQEASDAYTGDKLPGGAKPSVHYTGGLHPDDKPVIEAKLKEVEIHSYEDFEKLKKDFVARFNAKGLNVTQFVLDENLRIVLSQKPRYLAKDAKDPQAEINKLKKAARAVLDAMNPYMNVIREIFSMVVSVGPGNLDTIDELLLRQTSSGDLRINKEQADKLNTARRNWIKVRNEQGSTHMVLLGRDYNPNTILEAKDDVTLDQTMLDYFSEIEANIKTAKGKLNAEKFWELKPMIELTQSSMGVRKGEGAEKTISEAVAGHADDKALWNAIQAAASIALAIVAIAATGGLATIALVGSAGLSTYGAVKHTDEYMFQLAAANSAIDQAKTISKDQPSLFWLALDLVAAGLDLGAAASAFKNLASALNKAAKAAQAEKAALVELESAARAEFKKLSGIKMSEDQFVARLLEAAKKGSQGAETAVKQIQIVTELVEATSPRAAGILAGNEKAIKSVIDEFGNWKGLIGSLKSGGGDAAKMADNIAAYRMKIIDELEKEGASRLPGASMEPGSDFDLGVKSFGDTAAGENLIRLEKKMTERHPGYNESLLINLYSDKSQLMAVEEALNAVPAGRRTMILKEVTERSEKLNFAKMLEHAGDDPKAIQQVEEMMKSAGVKHSIEDIKAAGKAVHDRGRDAILKEIDQKLSDFNKLPPGDPKRVQLAEEITKNQMEVNFLMKEAYISPAALKVGPLTMAEAYQSALSQLEMMQHVLGACGGDIVKACREYEFFKYVNRYSAAAKKAGVKSPGLDYFDGLSSYIYKRNREAHLEAGAFPGKKVSDEAVSGYVDDAFLVDQYNMFRKEVNDSLPKIRKASEQNPAGGWRPEMPTPGPAAGKPPLPTLPQAKAAAQKNIDAAQKMTAAPGKTVPENALDASKKLASAGFSGTGLGTGVGVFKTKIPGVPHEVVVKMYPKGQAAKMEAELAAAIAAERTGIGPKVHGKVTGKATAEAPERVGFAMDEVKGGFADDYAAATDVAKEAAHKADMMKNAQNINYRTYADLNAYREGMFQQGFYYKGDLQGFVDANGRWKPIDVQGAEPIANAESLAKARELHDRVFDDMVYQLMKNQPKPSAVYIPPGGK